MFVVEILLILFWANIQKELELYSKSGEFQLEQRAVEKGARMGRPHGSIKTLDQLSAEYTPVTKCLKRGQSVRNTAKICGVSTSTVQRVKKAFNL